jgi:hypothetical protein
MRDGRGGTPGTPGNEGSVSCTLQEAIEGSNPSLSASKLLNASSLLAILACCGYSELVLWRLKTKGL